ncbi:FERM domain-containing protein 5-like [Actinia tenebrosa]|uniref:FERM domain-containing protein 5-like n=1 Tax=Actinia tenebrosa TaxID=6105 RepID=A0A6P8HMN5_ACTTE|nr:FERM domain-containing protein 5-like [Actinia tenebrosa]
MLKIGSKSNLDTEYVCKISLLDDTEMTCEFRRDAKGQVVFDTVCKSLDLLEKDYFGLRFVDDSKQRHWLDLGKSVLKQMKSLKPPFKLFFRVKFYAVDPSVVHEEITRYQFFLQIKRDILHGRLLCSYNELAELGAYIVQAELGDFDADDNDQGYVSEFRIVPKQSEKLEKKIAEIHKQLVGQYPSVAEKNFLSKVKALDMYGVDPHPCKDQDNVQLYLGLTPSGIAIIRDGKKVSGFDWPQIIKCSYDGKVFYIQVLKEERKANYGFRLPDPLACKHLWKCSVEHQAFYCSQSQKEIKPRRRSSLSPQRLFRRSKYKYSGPTQDEVIAESEKISRPEPEIKRTPSIRISRRLKPPTAADNRSESTGDLVLPTTPNYKKSTSDNPDPAVDLSKFETKHFPEVPVSVEDSAVSAESADVIDAEPMKNNNMANNVSPGRPKTVAQTPPKQAEVEYYGFKMFIFILFILALIMIPIAIVWETRKTYLRTTTVYKSFARWVFRSFGYRL